MFFCYYILYIYILYTYILYIIIIMFYNHIYLYTLYVITCHSRVIMFYYIFSHYFFIIAYNTIDKSLFYNYNIIMDMITFEWDEKKNEINKKKHKISFEEAKTVFYDEEALLIGDPEHSSEEERFIILGLSKKANLLVVCHCYRASETVIRIISARKATKTEEKQYRR